MLGFVLWLHLIRSYDNIAHSVMESTGFTSSNGRPRTTFTIHHITFTSAFCFLVNGVNTSNVVPCVVRKRVFQRKSKFTPVTNLLVVERKCHNLTRVLAEALNLAELHEVTFHERLTRRLVLPVPREYLAESARHLRVEGV